MKPVAITEAVDFLKKQGGYVSKILTMEHRQLVEQFIEFKQRTIKNIRDIEEFNKKRYEAELRWANAIPVWESEYSFLEQTPLSLYDCLIPKMKEQKLLIIDSWNDRWQISENNKEKARCKMLD